jgi:hypothetical protein
MEPWRGREGGEGTMGVQKKKELYEFSNRKQRQKQRKGKNNEFSNIGGVLHEFSYMQNNYAGFATTRYSSNCMFCYFCISKLTCPKPPIFSVISQIDYYT